MPDPPVQQLSGRHFHVGLFVGLPTEQQLDLQPVRFERIDPVKNPAQLVGLGHRDRLCEERYAAVVRQKAKGILGEVCIHHAGVRPVDDPHALCEQRRGEMFIDVHARDAHHRVPPVIHHRKIG